MRSHVVMVGDPSIGGGSSPDVPILAKKRTKRASGQRFPALLWALAHAPLFLVLYSFSIRASVAAVPARYHAALWPTFVPQALLVGLTAWLLALPLSFWPKIYRRAAPAVVALFNAGWRSTARSFGRWGSTSMASSCVSCSSPPA